MRSNFINFLQNNYYQMVAFIFFVNIVLTYPTIANGDSSIYFTYIKDFFIKPFTYGYEVKHGATGPLWVIINSVPYKIFGFETWLFLVNLFSKLLIVSSFVILSLSFSLFKQRIYFLLSLLVFVYTFDLYLHTSQIYEISLSVFLVSLSVYFWIKNYKKTMAITLGLLVLCRPELIIWGSFFVVVAYIKNIKTIMKIFMLASFPILFMYIYLGIQTETFIPTSIAGRYLSSIDNLSIQYFEKLLISINSLRLDPFLLFIYILTPLVYLYLIKSKNLANISREKTVVLSIIPFILLYIVFPPLGYNSRYLMPLIPLYSVTIAVFGYFIFLKLSHIRIFNDSFISLILLLFIVISLPLHIYKQDKLKEFKDFDRLLGKDLAEKLNHLNIEEDKKVAIYEIQFQFYSNYKLISLDGIVGGEVLKFLYKKESFKDFVDSNNIGYIVTMSSFKYRKIYQGTELERILEHDLNNRLGSQFIENGFKFTKIATNDIFSNPYSYEYQEDGLTVYSNNEKGWAKHWLMWNSVYKIEKIDN